MSPGYRLLMCVINTTLCAELNLIASLCQIVPQSGELKHSTAVVLLF